MDGLKLFGGATTGLLSPLWSVGVISALVYAQLKAQNFLGGGDNPIISPRAAITISSSIAMYLILFCYTKGWISMPATWLL